MSLNRPNSQNPSAHVDTKTLAGVKYFTTVNNLSLTTLNIIDMSKIGGMVPLLKTWKPANLGDS